jgi:phage shock protein A
MSGRFSTPPARMSRVDRELEKLRGGLPRSASGVPLMGIFSRTRDIVAANLGDLLDRAEDPTRTIRSIILEMEETLVEVRASAARTIADQKEMQRHALKLERLEADWADKAQLALSKGREDLARAALVEKRKATDLIQQLRAEIEVLDQSLGAYEHDIEQLQGRLGEARGRQTAIAARLASAESRVKLRGLLAAERIDEARARFDQLERRVDLAEGHAEALSLASRSPEPDLAGQIASLDDPVEAELAAMKRSLREPPEGQEG